MHKTRTLLAALLLGAATAGAGVGAPAAAARVLAGPQDKGPLLGEINFDSNQINTMVRASREKDRKARARGLSQAEIDSRQSKRSKFIRETAATMGKTYTPSEVDLLELGPDLRMYAPRDVEIKKISIKAYKDGYEAYVEDSPYVPANEQDLLAEGDASVAAEPYPLRTASGNFRLEVVDKTLMNATWERWVVKNDGNGNYNYYATKRRGYVEPLDTWTSLIQSMYMSSYPGSGYSSVFLWNDENVPGGSYENCGAGYNLGVAAGPIAVFSIAIPGSCTYVNVTHPDPGRYAMSYEPDGGAQSDTGAAEYGQSVVVPQGAEVRWGYTQQVVSYTPGAGNTICKSSGQPADGGGGSKKCPWN
ncbi:hypothetical protein GCM10010156_36260 [Planobispora rosea]|uniref:Secreted protein n=1 Tax=Planobispora rosea TaxID=35762 RepID=A0A8J3RYA5_PLARO|nr:hypothetical protein [Planobispora rosea]GGS74065.1 hypothetical protein GCM10010156_36260 [Planobispora rosea]GIH81699.1 hypothetical protein Pro02_01070 [Planobispora rosea]